MFYEEEKLFNALCLKDNTICFGRNNEYKNNYLQENSHRVPLSWLLVVIALQCPCKCTDRKREIQRERERVKCSLNKTLKRPPSYIDIQYI